MELITIDGHIFRDDTMVALTTPELGLIAVTPQKQLNFDNGTNIGLDLGWIRTPLGCLARSSKYNAKLSLYSNCNGYTTIQLAYHCNCPFDTHSHLLTWFDLQIGNSEIIAPNLGWHFNQPHNHPLVPEFQHLKKWPRVILPDLPTGKHGQFLQFA